jgi:GNAT superfamily N-acetyltransferase
MTASRVDIVPSKDIAPEEFAALMAAVGWGDEADYSTVVIQRSLAAYPFIAHARDAKGTLVGYVSAFSDGAFSAFVGELVVDPRVQRQGIGRRLMQAVEGYANGVPVYVHPFVDQEDIFIRLGYGRAQRQASVLFKRTQAA